MTYMEISSWKSGFSFAKMKTESPYGNTERWNWTAQQAGLLCIFNLVRSFNNIQGSRPWHQPLKIWRLLPFVQSETVKPSQTSTTTRPPRGCLKTKQSHQRDCECVEIHFICVTGRLVCWAVKHMGPYDLSHCRQDNNTVPLLGQCSSY